MGETGGSRRYVNPEHILSMTYMRIQLFFEGKPEPEVRDILKSNGFRWAPSVGAWQRQLNNNGKYAVERVIRELEEMEAAE